MDPVSPTTKAHPGAQEVIDKRADEVGKQFETMLLTSLYEEMFKTVPTSSLTGGGHAEDLWRGFMTEQYAKAASESGGIGIGKKVADMIRSYQNASNIKPVEE